MRILITLSMGWCLTASGEVLAGDPAGAPAFDLDVQRVQLAPDAGGGQAYRIEAGATVAAAPAVAWRVLTDYDHLADFVPDLESARVLARDGNKVMLEQRGVAHFLFFSHAIHLVVQVHEHTPDRIDVDLVDGDMKVYRCSWALSPVAGGGTRLVYKATIEPGFYVPGFVEGRLVKRDVAGMMAAVLRRIERN